MNIQDINYEIDITKVILWQYNDANNLISLVNDKQAYIDDNQVAFWQDWYDDVFNLLTANEFGLSIWCIILDIPYLIPIDPSTNPLWGFNQLPIVNTNVNYTRGNFAKSDSRITLTIEEQRILLRLRYFQLITDGAIISINNFLDLIFDDPLGIYQGGAWILDNLDMTAEYQFNVPISTNLLNAIKTVGVLPQPTGVKLIYTVL